MFGRIHFVIARDGWTKFDDYIIPLLLLVGPYNTIHIEASRIYKRKAYLEPIFSFGLLLFSLCSEHLWPIFSVKWVAVTLGIFILWESPYSWRSYTQTHTVCMHVSSTNLSNDIPIFLSASTNIHNATQIPCNGPYLGLTPWCERNGNQQNTKTSTNQNENILHVREWMSALGSRFAIQMVLNKISISVIN